MRVAIASRIFEPEPSAASFRLAALADALSASGHHVTLLTVRPPEELAAEARRRDSLAAREVKRWPVMRDKAGYVRGYLHYMSFDIPLFFRILFGAKQDLVISEPPPTTGFFVRLAAAMRRVPYAYYAADIWSDASAQTRTPRWMVRAVLGIEKFALRGARIVLTVSTGVTSRLAELGITDGVRTIGNGVNAAEFVSGLTNLFGGVEGDPPTFVYAGTASEWHGAEIFIEAMPVVLQQEPSARLLFVGGGSERNRLELCAVQFGVKEAVLFEPAMQPAELASLLEKSAGAVASVRPDSGYDFAFPTKLYSAAVCGAPLVYAGTGPAVEFVTSKVDGQPLGIVAPANKGSVAEAMIATLCAPITAARREQVSRWARENVSLDAVASRAVHYLILATRERGSA